MILPPDRKHKPLTVQSLAAEGSEGFQTDQLRTRLDRYGSARYDALQFLKFLQDSHSDEKKLIDALSYCGNHLVFHDYYTVGESRLASIRTCQKHLICPLCAIRRGAKALRVYTEKVQQLIEINPSLNLYFVTFTIKNGPDLAERFRHLSGNLRKLHKNRQGKGGKGEILKAAAGVWSYEFKRGKFSNEWHPHAHAMWLCREEPDEFKLSQDWLNQTGDSFIIDVQKVDINDPIKAFCEIFKYALKFSDLENEDRYHGHKTLRGKRLQDSFGALRGLNIEPEDKDDLLEDLPYVIRMFEYRGAYVQTECSGEVFQKSKDRSSPWLSDGGRI